MLREKAFYENSRVMDVAKRREQANKACRALVEEIGAFIPEHTPPESWGNVEEEDKEYNQCLVNWITHGGSVELQAFKAAHIKLLAKWREQEDPFR